MDRSSRVNHNIPERAVGRTMSPILGGLGKPIQPSISTQVGAWSLAFSRPR
jgi:hypothetical protein